VGEAAGVLGHRPWLADTATTAKTPGFRRNGEQTQAGKGNRQQHQKSFHVFLMVSVKQNGRKYIIGSGSHGRARKGNSVAAESKTALRSPGSAAP
jgi:hypothetical protein